MGEITSTSTLIRMTSKTKLKTRDPKGSRVFSSITTTAAFATQKQKPRLSVSLKDNHSTHLKGVKMAKKATSVSITGLGSAQAETIRQAFTAKQKADKAKKEYDSARSKAIPVILSKIFRHWTKTKTPKTGPYTFTMDDGTEQTVSIQDRKSTKFCDPSDAKDVMKGLNDNCAAGKSLKTSDVYVIKIDHSLNREAMMVPKVRTRVLELLVNLEEDLKKDQTIPPEIPLINENRSLVLAEHSLKRILALSDDFGKSMDLIGNPVTANIITKK